MTDGLILDIDLSKLVTVENELEGFPQLLGRELEIAMGASLDFLKGQIKARTPVNEDKLRGGINHQITSPFPNLEGIVGSPAEYAPVMEYGRKPGSKMPPVDALAIWAIRVLGVSRDESQSVGWALAKSIAKHGIEGKHMFEEGLEVSRAPIQTLFDNAIARAVQRMNQ